LQPCWLWRWSHAGLRCQVWHGFSSTTSTALTHSGTHSSLCSAAHSSLIAVLTPHHAGLTTADNGCISRPSVACRVASKWQAPSQPLAHAATGPTPCGAVEHEWPHIAHTQQGERENPAAPGPSLLEHVVEHCYRARPQQVCASCGTTKTPAWRRDKETGEVNCNACGLRKQHAAQLALPEAARGRRAGAVRAPRNVPCYLGPPVDATG
jgi:hypothetical protein